MTFWDRMVETFVSSCYAAAAMRLRIVFAFCLLTVACGPRVPTPVLKTADGEVIDRPEPPNEEQEQQANQMELQAHDREKMGDTSGAENIRTDLVKRFPATAAAARIYLVRAEAARSKGAIQDAIIYFEKLLFYRPTIEGADQIRERYATLLMTVQRYNDAANMWRALYESSGPTDRPRRGLEASRALAAAKRHRDALELAVDAYNLTNIATSEKQELTTLATDLVSEGVTLKEASELWSAVKNKNSWAFLHPLLAFRIAKIYYHTRDFEKSEDTLKFLTQRYPESPYAATAREFLQRLDARFQVDSRALGVVLPLSGKYQIFGERVLQAIKLGLGPNSPYKIIVKDSQGEPATAARVVEELVLQDHVLAIMGPLFSKEAAAAAMKAEELSVPLLCLSHGEKLAEIGPYVFRTVLTVGAQAQELARVAFEKLHMQKFALLYPSNSYGEEFVQAFWDEVDKRRGEIRAVETYEFNQTTFQDPIRKLVGRYYASSREDYREALRVLKTQKLPPHRLQAEIEKLEKKLPPIVDFDAIVIPDSSKNLGLIAPALAFEDIVLEHDPKALERIRKATGNKNAKPVTLLGGSTWNSPQTIEACEQYCEQAIFVDAFYPDSAEARVRDFVAAFQTTTNAAPNLLEAQGYDTAGMLHVVIQAARPKDRAALKDALARAPTYTGITGKTIFDNEGSVNKELLVLTIKERTIRLWDPASSQSLQ